MKKKWTVLEDIVAEGWIVGGSLLVIGVFCLLPALAFFVCLSKGEIGPAILAAGLFLVPGLAIFSENTPRGEDFAKLKTFLQGHKTQEKEK
ncbi:hypothetical protein LCGC14_1920920 [marine sediment metagenome]|uniref:Uncharacterized protein n=1 Tax=marine sediment metagenome TaxID=412755 RepID=A0A0F9INJ6_9ZZZZ